MKSILNFNDPVLEPFKSLRYQKKSFIAEGVKVIGSLIDSPIEIKAILTLKKYLPQLPESVRDRLFLADESIMEQIIGYRMHQGIMALALIPPERPLDELTGPAIALNGLANAENVGAIMRNAAAFGINNIIYDGACSPPYLRRTVKTCMGAVFNMNCFGVESLESAFTIMKGRGYTILGADPHEANIRLNEIAISSPYALVIGSEGMGMEEPVKAACDKLFKIPISPDIDSLNAAAASAISLYVLQSNFTRS